MLLVSCAAMKTSSEYAKLELSSSLDRPVFLKYQTSQSVFLIVDCPVIEWKGDIKERIAHMLEAKGYKMATNSEAADIVMTVGFRHAGEMEKTNARQAQNMKNPTVSDAISGNALISGATGGDAISTLTGAAGQLIMAPVLDATINQWVYLGALEVDAFIEFKESNPNNRTEYQNTITRAVARARQANLKWEEAFGPVQDALVKQIGQAIPKKSGPSTPPATKTPTTQLPENNKGS